MGRATTRRGAYHQRLRWIIQSAIVVFVLLLSVGHARGWSWAASLHTVCPFGGVANLYTYFASGGYVAKLHEAVFVLLLALLAGLLLTGKSFCGWICPLGSVQELLGKAGRRLWPRLFNRVPTRVDKVLRLGKWVVLVLVLVQTARTGKLFFQDYDPYYNLFSIWSDEIALSGYLLVALTLAAALFVERPFCRYACPLGALTGLTNTASAVVLRRDAGACIDCGQCDRACPAGVQVSTAGTVRSLECSRCLACTAACPVNRQGGAALRLEPVIQRRHLGRSLPVPAYFSIALLAFAAPIGLTSLSGDFVTETQHVYETPGDIRGSTPLTAVVESYGIGRQELYNGFALPAQLDPATKLKDVPAAMGLSEGSELVSTELVRVVVAALDTSLQTLVQEGAVEEESLSTLANSLTPAGSNLDVGDLTLREAMASGPAGAAVFLLTGEWPPGESAAGLASAAGSTTTPAAGEDIGAGANTAGSKTAGATESTSEPGAGGAEAGSSSIRGSTTLGELEEMVEDFPALLTEFGIAPDEPAGAQLKDLDQKYGFEVSAVRDFVEGE